MPNSSQLVFPTMSAPFSFSNRTTVASKGDVKSGMRTGQDVIATAHSATHSSTSQTSRSSAYHECRYCPSPRQGGRAAWLRVWEERQAHPRRTPLRSLQHFWILCACDMRRKQWKGSEWRGVAPRGVRRHAGVPHKHKRASGRRRTVKSRTDRVSIACPNS